MLSWYIRKNQGELPSSMHTIKHLNYTENYCIINSIVNLITSFPPDQCDFRKRHSVQLCLLVMIEKFKEAIDKGHDFGALLTELSKAFHCINHRLLIAKLYSHEISLCSINLLSLYLNHRTQRIKINDCFTWDHYYSILI